MPESTLQQTAAELRGMPRGVYRADCDQWALICSVDAADRVEDYDSLCDVLIRISPVPVAFEKTPDPSLLGYYSHDTRSIVIRSGMSEAQTIKTRCLSY